MKKILPLILLLTITFAFAEVNYFVNNVVIEMAVDQSTGSDVFIEAVNNVHNIYDLAEVASIRYYPENSEYGNAETQAMIDNNFSQMPEMLFSGTNSITNPNINAVENCTRNEYFKASPVKMELVAFDNTSGNITVSIEVLDETVDLSQMNLNFVLIEQNIADNITNIARDIETNSLDLTTGTQEFSATFAIDPLYSSENLKAVVYLKNADNIIVQSITNFELPAIKIRAAVPFERVTEGPDNGNQDMPFFAVFNLGEATTHNVGVIGLDAPNGWSVSYCDHESCFFWPVNFDFEANGSHEFHATVVVGGPGEMHYQFEVINEALPETFVIPFLYHTEGVNNYDDSVLPTLTDVTNYPNPFNPATSINFSLAQDDNVKISIFDLKGKYVETLTNENYALGNHSILWDASQLSSGIYFYKIETSTSQITKKLTLLK